jgi:hypothetical protein
MPSIQLTFRKNNFTAATPNWDVAGEYSNGLRFNTVSKTLELDNTNHGLVSFTISPSGTTDYDFGSVHFSTPNGSIVSVATAQDELYLPHNIELASNSHVFKNEEVSLSSITYYVIVNGDPDNVTSLLNISIALAKDGSIPSTNPIIDLSWDCSPSGGTIYEYEMGLHTWSPYDAKNDTGDNPTLTTKLYSFSPISDWTSFSNKRVYSSPYFENPALNYYYGYGDKVYRVGEPWSRSYGLRYFYETRVTWHGFFKKRTNTELKTIGPEETRENIEWNGNQSWESLACIEPTMRNVGRIRQRYNNNTLTQPEKYTYYLGYHPSIKPDSNSKDAQYYEPFLTKYRTAGPFTQWSYRKKRSYGITGLVHALSRLTTGIVRGYDPRETGRFPFWGIAGPLGLAVLAKTEAGLYIANQLLVVLDALGGPFSQASAWIGKIINATGSGNVYVIALMLLILIVNFIKAFRPQTIPSREVCNSFLHHYTSTPYINLSDEIYRDDAFTTKNLGWYSDGVYYYYQPQNSGVNFKELSYINAWNLDEENPKFFTDYSYPADNPTLVTDFKKLILLSYCSGKPIPYCGLDGNNNPNPIYSSKAFSHTVEYTCCALEDCSNPTVISLPEGFVRSCISQADADDQAEEHFSASIEVAKNSSYGKTLHESIGQLNVFFTHEIKEEDNPTTLSLFYDIRSGSDAPIGTPLYYDFTGCQKALPGYYATGSTSSSYPKYYYKVEDGKVAAIYTQSAASSTTVSPGNYSIITTDKDKSSNWYLKGTNKSMLSFYILYTNNKTFDVNSYFTYSFYTLSAGHIISGSYSNGAFQKYASYDSNGITSINTSEQGTGWYAPLNGWKPDDEDLFFYQFTPKSWTGGPSYATSQSAICASTLNTTRYHDGVGDDPNLGDKIYDTNTIEDPTDDGFIKFSSGYYLQVVDGVVSNITSCTQTPEFSGSTITGSLDGACVLSINTLYEHNGSSSFPTVGDTVSVSGGSTVSNGFINTSIGTLQTDSDGMIVDIIDCSSYTGLPLDMEVGLNSILGESWYGYSDPNNLNLNSNDVTGDGAELVSGFLGASLGEGATDWRISWNLITWLGWRDDNVYMALRKTSNVAFLPFTSLSLTTDLSKTAMHLPCDNTDYGLNTTSTNIYLYSPTANGYEDYATSIIPGMSVTDTTGNIPAGTFVASTPTWVQAIGTWIVPVEDINGNNVTITYNNVCGNSLTFTKNNHTSTYYNNSSATVTTYTSVNDVAGGSADYIVYKWSSTSNPFVQSGQDVEVNFTYSTP